MRYIFSRKVTRASVCLFLIQTLFLIGSLPAAQAAVQRKKPARNRPGKSQTVTNDVPTELARRIAKDITREAILPPRGPEGRPLPLASQWNMGTARGTFGPDFQIGLLQDGHHILPWMAWPVGRAKNDRVYAYQDRLLHFFAELKLPFTMRGTQWNQILTSKQFRSGPEENFAGVIRPDGKRTRQLSPFGSIDVWKIPASVYVDTEGMRRAQKTYPDPPLVVWLSNNEPSTLRWAKNGPLEHNSKKYVDLYGEGQSGEFKRRVMGEGWIERYNVMFDAMRAALVDSTWRKTVRFVGYGAFGPSHFGRWGQWKVYSKLTEKWTSPTWFYWEGASPSYYTHNWNQNRDNWVFSTQVESMNWIFMQEEALRANPDFWFEMSTWDGNNVKAWKKGLGVRNDSEVAARSSIPMDSVQRERVGRDAIKGSKAIQYLVDGQDYPPERAAGWVQFGMWLLRPRVVREFRGHTTPLEAVKPYWMETVYAVDRVWDSDTLAAFWRYGKLVENHAHKHPYQLAIPEKYRDIRRWYLLDTSLDEKRPWELQTPIPVFSLALVRGESGSREWLVYAHAPLKEYDGVAITIPEYGDIVVDVPRAGAFYLVSESGGAVTQVR